MSKKRVNEIMENFSKSKTKRQKKEGLWKELDAFDRNEQWNLAEAPAWLPKPVTNFIHLVKYTKRAAFAVENPTGKLRPVSPKGIDGVKMLNKAYEDAFARLKARSVVRDCISTAKLLGTAIAHIYWDENKEGRLGATVQGDEGFQYEGDMKIKEIEPASFYPDPNAFTIDDCRFIIIRERRQKEWIEKHPKFKDKFNKQDETTDDTSSPEERGEIYGRDYTTSQKEGIIDFISYYSKEMNDEGGFTYSVEYIAGGKYLGKDKLRPNRYPFSILYDFQQRQDFFGISTCELILDNQKIINKVESIITLLGTMMQNPQKIVHRDSGIDPKKVAKYGHNPGQVWLTNTDPSNSIKYADVPTIPMTLLNLLDNAKGNIREITGLTESYMGQNVGSLQTSSGVQALIDRSTMRDRDQMYDIELFVEDLSKLMIDFMTEYYEEERLIRVFDKHGDVQGFEVFVGTAFKDLEYDIAIDVSSKAPITRMREINDAKELMNLQGQYGANYPVQIIKPQEAIEMMNLVHGQQIIDRMNMEEMTNKTDQAMQVATMLSEAMAQGVPPEELNGMAMAMFESLNDPNAAAQTGAPNSFNPNQTPQGA